MSQVRIGRRPDLELSLAYSALSGVHARLLRSEGEWLLEDLGSTNGTFVGGERLKPGVKHPVGAGTQIKLGEIKLIFDGEPRSDAKSAEPAPKSDPKIVERTPKDDAKVGEPTPRTQVKAAVPEAAAPTPSIGVKAAAPTPTIGVKAAAPTPTIGVKSAAPTPSIGVKAAAPTPSIGVKAAAPTPTIGVKAAAPTPTIGVRATAPTPVLGVRGPTPTLGMKVAEALSKSDVRAPEPAPKAVEPTQTFVRRPLSESVSAAPGPAVPFLTVVAGLKDGTTKFRLEKRDHAYMFGRTRRCEFRVKTSEVSREHASFMHRSDGIYVKDLGSINGVLVNNTKVNEFRLYDGDLIQLGHIKLRLFDPTETGGRGTDSVSSTPSRLAPHGDHAPRYDAGPPAERSSTYASEFHPAIAGALDAEQSYQRPRRQSVRVMFTENWEGSSRFRYGLVIVAAALLAVVAVTLGFRFAG